MKKYVKKFHVFFKNIVRIPTSWYLRGKVGWHHAKTIKLSKKEGAIILSNHQTDFDPVMVGIEFNRPVYFVAADSIFSKKLLTWFIMNFLGAIPKKKGMVDSSAVRGILQVIKAKGVVGIFPEGNRTLCEEQFPIDSSISKLIKKCNVNLIIYNIHGGTAVYPRFASSPRKGKSYGEVKCILTPDEYNKMSDEELTQFIIDNIRVYDSENGERCITKHPAEHLERLLFVCPKCGHLHTLVSSGEKIRCSNCALEATFDETLHFSSNDKDFKFKILNDWIHYQKLFMRSYDYPKNGEVIFEDDEIDLKLANPYTKRILLSHGKLVLTDKTLSIGDKSFDIKDITSSTLFSGNKLLFSVGEDSYLALGNDKYNALKYVYMFNLLDTLMKENKTDHYYNLD